jgi:hypothetical protein
MKTIEEFNLLNDSAIVLIDESDHLKLFVYLEENDY